MCPSAGGSGWSRLRGRAWSGDHGVGVVSAFPAAGRVPAIVPLHCGETGAASTGSALGDLRRVSLLRRCLTTLTDSGAISRVLVVASTDLAEAVHDHVPDPADLPVRVLVAAGSGHGRQVLAALGALPASEPAVVVHDPLHALAPETLVRTVVEGLDAAPADGSVPGRGHDAVIPVRPVTDTLKWVTGDDVITTTADRDRYWLVGSPQGYRLRALRAGLEAATEADLRARGADALPGLVRAAGYPLHTVPAPDEVFRVADPEGVQLAEAVLHAADLQTGPRRP